MNNDQKVKIATSAVENLNKITGIDCIWEVAAENVIDGNIKFDIWKKNFIFSAIVRNDVRHHQLEGILNKVENTESNQLIIISERFSAEIKNELRKNNLAYLEGNGNFYFCQQDVVVWIESQKSIKAEESKNSRVFAKTGLKIIFNILLDSKLVNKSYRVIATRSDVALGTVKYTISGLIEWRFIIRISKKRLWLRNKKDLQNIWIKQYNITLAPKLLIGTFSFQNKTDYHNWREIKFNNEETQWGGEPAAALLIENFQPETLTIYTKEEKDEIIKNYNLIEDIDGNVKVYEKFWKGSRIGNNTVPPLLIYTDLINSCNNKNYEIADRIYEDYIDGK